MSACNIAVVGGGQLGSRHLQALARISRTANIFVVDPVEEALQVASERYAAVSQDDRNRLSFLTTTSLLPDHLDLAIVATTADVRLAVIRSILENSTVANWLLEKVLFQNLEEYGTATELLGQYDAPVWVNCAQRMWPFFIELRERFQGDPDLELDVVGSSWGLGSNAVHNADIASWLWSTPLHYKALVDSEIPPSKRPGFREFTGTLEITAEGGGYVRQTSFARGSAPFSFIFKHPTAHAVWNVSAGRMWEACDANGWNWTEREMVAPFQSSLTTDVVNSILSARKCALPTLAETVPVHVGVLEALIKGALAHGVQFGKVCPVT